MPSPQLANQSPTAVAPAGPASATTGDQRAGFTQAVHSEWTKLRSLRSAMWTLAAMAGGILGIAVFVGATGSLQPDDTVLGGSLTGAGFGLLVGASFGVLMMAREYAAGTIRTAVTVLTALVVLLIAGDLAMPFVAMVLDRPELRFLNVTQWTFDVLTRWPGPFHILAGNWSLIDV